MYKSIQGRKGKDKDVFYSISYEGITFSINFLNEVQAIFHFIKVVFDGHAPGIVGQTLDGLVGGGTGVGQIKKGGGELTSYQKRHLLLAEHGKFILLRRDQKNARLGADREVRVESAESEGVVWVGMMMGRGMVVTPGLPEWEEFFKIGGSGGECSVNYR